MAASSLQSYPKSKVLFMPGDVAKAVYLILDGTIIASQGDEAVSLGQGAIVGDVAFFQDTEHFYAAVCATDVTAMVITKENSREIFEKQPSIACSLLRELAFAAANPGKLFFEQGLDKGGKSEPKKESSLLPKGHPVFSGRASAEHQELLFPTDVTCPICKAKYTAMRTRTSRLQVAEYQPDFRAVYRNFEPNFYYIWVCPSCLFAYPERQYARIPQRAIKRGQAYLKENPVQGTFSFDGQRTIDQVITAYYLALKTFEVVRATPEQWANLWLRLVWIYEDLEQADLVTMAAENAYKYFAEAMSQTARSAAGDQQLYIIMGELDLRLNRQGEAFKNFHAAATLVGGDPRHKRMAADRIQDLKER